MYRKYLSVWKQKKIWQRSYLSMVCSNDDRGGEGKSSGDLGRLLLILAIYQKSSVINLTNQPLMKKMCFNKYVIQFQWKPKWDNALVWMQWLKAAVLAASKSIKLIFKMDRYRHIPNDPNQLVMSSSQSSPSSSLMRVAGCRIPIITLASALPLMLAGAFPVPAC